MTKVKFQDEMTIEVVAKDKEQIFLRSHAPVSGNNQNALARELEKYFDKNFSDDKISMVYWVLMDCMNNIGFSFSYQGSDRDEERKRLGSRIRELREQKGIEAKQLAALAKIDAANLSRIEQGRYSVGLDILTRISGVLGAKVDLVTEH